MERSLRKFFFSFIVVDLTPVIFSGASRHIACARHRCVCVYIHRRYIHIIYYVLVYIIYYIHWCRVKAELNTLAFLFVRLKYPLGHPPGKFICTRSRDTVLRVTFLFFIILNVFIRDRYYNNNICVCVILYACTHVCLYVLCRNI